MGPAFLPEGQWPSSIMDSTEFFFSLNMAKIGRKPKFITTQTAMYVFHNCQYFVTEEHKNYIFKDIKCKV